jgi:hypothetical protein
MDGVGYNMCTVGMLKGFGLDRIKAADIMLQTLYSEAKNDGKVMTTQKLAAQAAYSMNLVDPAQLAFNAQSGPIDMTGGPQYAHTCFGRLDIDQPGYSETHDVVGTVYYIDAQGKKQTLPAGSQVDVLWCFSWRGGHTGGSSPYQWPDGKQNEFSTYMVLSVVNIDSSPPLENYLGPGTVQYRVAEQIRRARAEGKAVPNRHDAYDAWVGRRQRKHNKDYLSREAEERHRDGPEDAKTERKHDSIEITRTVRDIEDLISDSLTRRPSRLVTTPMSGDGVIIHKPATLESKKKSNK